MAVTRLANEACRRAGHPPIFALAAGGADVGARMASDARLPLVSATGSCRMGRAVGEAVVGVLRIAQSALSADPRLKLAVTVVDLSLEDGYAVLAGREARVRVDQLLTLQDGNLRAIDALGRLYVEDVRKLKAVKQARAGLVAGRSTHICELRSFPPTRG